MHTLRHLIFSITGFFVLIGLAFTGAGAAAADETARANASEREEDLVHVRMVTSRGEIILALNRGKAPVTVKNFAGYAEDGFYDGTIFHRVVRNFVIQGGGFTRDLQPKTTREPIENEWDNGLRHKRGTIAMARARDQPNSATSQFFINVRDNEALDQPTADGTGYAVFGRVVAGMDVVDAIRAVPVGPSGGHTHVPREPVVIERVRIITAAEAREAIEQARDQDPAESEATS